MTECRVTICNPHDTLCFASVLLFFPLFILCFSSPFRMMLLVSALLAVCVMAYPPGGKDKFFFRAAGPGDARSPCPGLNALANHGYINRNGRNIKGEDIISAASAVYNIAPR